MFTTKLHGRQVVRGFCLVCCLSFASSALAATLNLTFESSFSTGFGEDIAYDPSTGNLVVPDGDSLEIYTTAGAFVSSIDVSGVVGSENVRGLSVLPNGNFLLSANDRVVEVNSSGAVPGGGIDFTLGVADEIIRGAVLITSSNTIFGVTRVTRGASGMVREFSLVGDLLNSYSLPSVGDYEGISSTPDGTRLLIADDSNGQLVEMDLLGNETGTYDLAALTGESPDPEGVSVASGFVFVSSDGDSLEGVYIFSVPEPTSALLSLVGIAAFAFRRRRV